MRILGVHLSNGWNSEEREWLQEMALFELEQPSYSLENLALEKKYIAKKLSVSEEEFNAIIEREPKWCFDYPNSEKSYNLFRTCIAKFSKKRN